LFAAEDIASGTFIGEYTGTMLKCEGTKSKASDEKLEVGTMHKMIIAKGYCIHVDLPDNPCILYFLNDQQPYNVAFECWEGEHKRKIYGFATQDILRGAEMFVRYNADVETVFGEDACKPGTESTESLSASFEGAETRARYNLSLRFLCYMLFLLLESC
jgi:hypothetical protein